MSPERTDPDLKPRRSRRAAQSTSLPHGPVNRLDLLHDDSPLIAVLPAILNDAIKDAPIAVMTRIALDWIIQSTPFDQLFEQTAEDQYTRQFTLEHLVLVMLDVV